VHGHWEQRSQTRAKSAGDYLRPAGFTIALAREAGARGPAVGREVGNRLGWPVYDQELLTLIARNTGLHASLLAKVDERSVSDLHECVTEILAGFGQSSFAGEYTYARHLMEVLTALGMLGECVIVGRGAAHLLPPETTLRVRLVAPRPDRIATLSRQFQVSLAEAERRLEEIDQERRTFIQRHFRRDPFDPANYDLFLNVARFTLADCANLIIQALHHRQARTASAGDEPAEASAAYNKSWPSTFRSELPASDYPTVPQP
jgi:hypothetical protein